MTPDVPRPPDVHVLGRLLRSSATSPRGRFRAVAEYVSVQGPPPSELPRHYSPFRADGPPPTGLVHEECEIAWEDRDRWSVTTSAGGTYRRTGNDLVIRYPDHAPLEMDVGNLRAPNVGWPYYAGQWAEDLLLPHRLVGLLDDLVVVEDDPVRPRLRGDVSLRQPEAYTGVAGEEVLEVEFTADLDAVVIVEARAMTWDRRTASYSLEVLDR
ncbi:hypothetical protein [Actinomycetospora termitidis]|uniref:Uncharacterized protein n=1 Tax=Actinomycetospora termitidis TaxID=3053470 RepID=A0ABT7MAI3_9PSEU|nr:hypothetical protein [Actinomycetospora sp. Odt1-22]MDL5157214.1 hypothetical protein [Actinomycetospora sp. Odt1-22]